METAGSGGGGGVRERDVTLVYLSTGVQDTAVPSQVEPLLRALDLELPWVHFSLEPWHQWRASRAIAGVRPDPPRLVRQLPVMGRATLHLDGRRLAPAVERATAGQPFVVHARGHVNAYRARALRRLGGCRGIVADLRGALADENERYAGTGVWNRLRRCRVREFARIDKVAVDESDHLLCVSNAFARHLHDSARVPAARVTVVPSFADVTRFAFSPERRTAVRQRLGVADRFVVVYAGGLAGWQMPRETVALFRSIREQVPNAFLLFLTHRPADAAPIVAGLDPRDYLLTSSPQHEMADYLNAADAGLLLREPTLTNRVASPIKFSEYVCCGLPVVITTGIGDTAEFVARWSAGIVLDDARATRDWREGTTRLSAAPRQRIACRAADVFGLPRLAATLLALYRSFQ